MLPRRHKESTSAQRLAFRHRERLIKTETLRNDVPSDLRPGYLQLYSYYVPGLQLRTYSIDVKQNITAGGIPATLGRSQSFTVLGPRFTLPDKVVHFCISTSG